MDSTDELSNETSQEASLSQDPNLFCHFPPLFRLYDRSAANFLGTTPKDEIPLMRGRLNDESRLETITTRRPGGFRPSRLVCPDGKVEKQSVNTNAADYIVVSYTWGRWMKEDRSSDTNIDGCHWKVPATTLFTRQQLDDAVRTIAGGRHFWLDVFCIPQNDADPEKAQEISRQGDIFSNATWAAVWLNSGGEGILQDICSWTDEDCLLPALDLDPTPDRSLHKETLRRFGVLQSLPKAIPWTTSLWTLQETALRRDAVFHDRSGMPVVDPRTGRPLTVESLIKVLTQIEMNLRLLRSVQHNLKKGDRTALQSALSVLDSLALGDLDNMTARDIYLASKRRVCQRDHDRVYAIMNALGVLVPVDYNAPVQELQRAFLLQLYRTYPAEMYSFLEFSEDPGSQFTAPALAGIRARSLFQMHQSRETIQHTSPFSNLNDKGFIIVDDALSPDNTCIEEICCRIKDCSAAVCYDDKGRDRLMSEENWREQQTRTALNFKKISTLDRIVLVPLGVLQATSWVGPLVAYLVCIRSLAEAGPHDNMRVFRIGLLVSTTEVPADQIFEKVALKHDLVGGIGTQDLEISQNHEWICDKDTSMYFHPPWTLGENCKCFSEEDLSDDS